MNATHLSCLLGLLLAACGGGAGERAEISNTRTASIASEPVLPGATDRQRFAESLGGGNSAPSASGLDYELPAGWKELPPTKERAIHLQPAGNPDATCYYSFLPGSAGGLEGNVNRWLGQFGADPLEPEAIAALPKHTMLGVSATLVEVEGTFSAMGSAPKEGQALLGLIATIPMGATFLKFTGPAAVVQAERANFLALASSLRMGGSGAGAAPAASDGTGGGGSGFVYQVPASWQEAPPKAMRAVNLSVGGGKAECYITVLGGDGGGLVPNLNRWRGQFGAGPLSQDELAALERVTVLGQEVQVLEVTGSFTGMENETKNDQGMLGVAWIGDGRSLFVKLIGPRDVVHAERANFVAFLRSLREEQ